MLINFFGYAYALRNSNKIEDIQIAFAPTSFDLSKGFGTFQENFNIYYKNKSIDTSGFNQIHCMYNYLVRN